MSLVTSSIFISQILDKLVKILPVMLSESEASRSWLAERDSSLAPLAQNDTIWLVGLGRSFTSITAAFFGDIGKGGMRIGDKRWMVRGFSEKPHRQRMVQASGVLSNTV